MKVMDDMVSLQSFPYRKLLVPLVIFLGFSILGFSMWMSSGYLVAFLHFGYLGLAVGGGLALFALLPKKQKPLGRRIALFAVGLYLFMGIGVLSPENIQIEGFFLSLLSGTFYAAGMHYLIAKIIGPLVFGRLWCGWACWTAMILDLLPFTRAQGRVPGRWDWLRYAHFALSLGLVAGLWYLAGYRPEVNAREMVVWFLGGNLLYYAIGIGLAYALKDNRAFCKYVCPVAVPLKIGAHLSLLKIASDAEKCNDCGACARLCPMDIDVPSYAREGKRVLSTECTLCQTCVSTCAHDALKLGFGFDLGGDERLQSREIV